MAALSRPWAYSAQAARWAKAGPAVAILLLHLARAETGSGGESHHPLLVDPGLRIGELAGLHVRDVVMRGRTRTANVRQVVTETGGHLKVGPTVSSTPWPTRGAFASSPLSPD